MQSIWWSQDSNSVSQATEAVLSGPHTTSSACLSVPHTGPQLRVAPRHVPYGSAELQTSQIQTTQNILMIVWGKSVKHLNGSLSVDY